VVLMENHDQALEVWRQGVGTARTLVHVDAHHDMSWVAEGGEVNIANFICQALRDGLVQEVFWVVPDPTWQAAKSRRRLYGHIRRLARAYSGNRSRVSDEGGRLSASLLGVPLVVCPLDSLPPREGVLLDLDTDFMVMPRPFNRPSNSHSDYPWIWPGQLVERLGSIGAGAHLTTIAYSVAGGYTPLPWKHLGDALAVDLKAGAGTDGSRHGYGCLRKAALATQRGDITGAEVAYRHAAQHLPRSAAPVYNLARLYAATGRAAEAQALHREALSLDPSYRTPYSSRGRWYFRDRRLEAAEHEYGTALTMNPSDAYAHLGLAELAAARKRWNESEQRLEVALTCDARLVDAWRLLGDVRAKAGRHAEAADAYQRSLDLARRGHTSLAQPLATAPPSGRLRDVGYGQAQVKLARANELRGRLAEAIASYRDCIATGHDGVAARMRLARACAKSGQWAATGREIMAALGRVPRGTKGLIYRAAEEIRRRRRSW
jgi:Tfp pilus assembly protein PilF